jgi:hypothetical protein
MAHQLRMKNGRPVEQATQKDGELDGSRIDNDQRLPDTDQPGGGQ